MYIRMHSVYSDYHYITKTVAIGNHRSSHQTFHIIVNVASPVKEGLLRSLLPNGKILYQTDFTDSEVKGKYAMELQRLLKRDWKKNRRRHILFQCLNGRETSTGTAVAFWINVMGLPLNQILDQILEKRVLFRQSV